MGDYSGVEECWLFALSGQERGTTNQPDRRFVDGLSKVDNRVAVLGARRSTMRQHLHRDAVAT
jgi:hypothetical protein